MQCQTCWKDTQARPYKGEWTCVKCIGKYEKYKDEI